MEIHWLDQLGGFGIFCLFGMALGVYYTVFKLLRHFIRYSRRAIFFQDLFFFVTSAIVTFMLLMNVTNGEVRGYILLAVFLGFLAYYFTLGLPIFLAGRFVIDLFRKGYRNFERKIFAPIRSVLKKISNKIFSFMKKSREKGAKWRKKTLFKPKKVNKKAKLA